MRFLRRDGPALPLSLSRPTRVCVGGDARSRPIAATLEAKAEIYQDSSGGENWNRYQASQFHPRPNSYVSLKGYRTLLGGVEAAAGQRALGWLDVSDAGQGLTVGVEDFWQNYPKALAADQDGTVEIGLFPADMRRIFPCAAASTDTRGAVVFHAGAAGEDGNKAIAVGFSAPLRLEASPQWLAKTRASATSTLSIWSTTGRTRSAIFRPSGLFRGHAAGPSLFSRREENEFYGWMDYGDVSIDFEAPSGQWGMKYDLDYRLASNTREPSTRVVEPVRGRRQTHP